MSVKQDLLKILEDNKNTDVSGESIAQRLGVSRTAIWKAVNSLREDGYDIDSGTNKGYRLKDTTDALTEEGIRIYLPGELSNIPIYAYNDIDSTNKEAARLNLASATPGSDDPSMPLQGCMFVVADKQTAGRGRLGRSFYSPASGGLYMSLLFRPPVSTSDAVLTTVASSVAVMRAIRRVCGLQCDIKWVNDLYLEGRKVCGILTEAGTDFESGQINHVIVGIGINCDVNDFPDELQSIAGSLKNHKDCHAFTRGQLAASVLTELVDMMSDLPARRFMDEYRQYSLVIGRDVDLLRPGHEALHAHVYDIDDNGALLIDYLDQSGHRTGQTEAISSGEVSLRLSSASDSAKS